MHYFLMTMLSVVSLIADVHYAKVEPFSHYIIKSTVAGEVIYANESVEGKTASEKAIIIIDSEIDEVELLNIQKKSTSLEEILLINEEVLEKKEAHYKRINKLKTKSQTEKDYKFFDLAATKEKVQTLKQALGDLNLRKKQLEKSLKDKHIVYENFYVYKLLTKKGEVVNPGTPLIKIADIKSAKLTIYLNKSELDNITNKTIYIDDVKSDLLIDKIWKIADSNKVSAYRAEILMPAPKKFSKLLKVEFK